MRSSICADIAHALRKWHRIIPFLFSKIYYLIKCSVSSLSDQSALKRSLLSSNDIRLMSLRNIHKEKRGFVIGNGPSLLVSDLDQLTSEITFGSNKIYLAYDETIWRPTYYSVTDIQVARNNSETIRKLQTDKIFASGVQSALKNHNDILWLSNYRMMRGGEPVFDFSKDLVLGARGGFSVIYHQLQLAYHMGLTDVYLLGIDFKFDVKGRTGEDSVHGEILKHEGGSNHFHPDYRKPGEKWTMPRLDMQKQAFECAKKAFEADGRHIYNASRETALDVFPRVKFEDIIAKQE